MNERIILLQTYTSRTQWLRIYGDETKGSMNKRDILMVCKMILQYLRRISEEKWKQYEFFRMQKAKGKCARRMEGFA